MAEQERVIPLLPQFDEEPWFERLSSKQKVEALKSRKEAIVKDISGLTGVLCEYFPDLIASDSERVEAFVERWAVGRAAVHSAGFQAGIDAQRNVNESEINRLSQFQINVMGND